MNRDSLAQYYSDNVGLIHVIAAKAHRRVLAVGGAYDYNDLCQDLTEVFIKSYDQFNDNLGWKFSTYFTAAAYHRVNRVVGKITAERVDYKVKSTQEIASRCEEGSEIFDLEDASQNPEAAAASSEMIELMLDSLSPLALKIIGLTIDPPDFLERELDAAMAHSILDREQGGKSRSGQHITVHFVCSVLDKTNIIPADKLREARREINTMAKGYFV